MGETQEPQQVEHVHRLAADQFEDLIELLASARRPVVVNDPGPAQTPYDLGLEPWMFYSPHHSADAMAYVDDRNQVRHVPLTRSSEVPKTWRRVWLEPPA